MPRKLFAVIPAAGRSRRMGRPKLLLPLGAKTVLERLLSALEHPAITARVLVVHRDDAELAELARSAGARVVTPEIPPDEMRVSVEHALRSIEVQDRPAPEDGWLLIPADHPMLSPSALSRIVTAWDATDAAMLVPTCEGRRGHPTFFRWSLVPEVFALPADVGLNHLVADRRRVEVELADESILTDLDTPEDYARLCRWWNAHA